MAIIAGLAFSLIAVAYRACSTKGISPSFPAIGMGLAGTLYFAFRSFAGADAPGYDAPVVVWIWGVANGVAQGLMVHLYRIGLQSGPLAPLWCAGSLTFVTPALFAVFVAGEHLSKAQSVGMGLAFLCVITAAMGRRSEAGPARARRAWRAKLLFAGILLLMVVMTGLTGIALKHMAMLQHRGLPMNPTWNNCFMLGMYAMLMVWTAISSAGHGRPRGTTKTLLLYSLLAGVGSVVGMILTAILSNLPGGTGFAALAVTAVLAGSLISSFCFGEKRDLFWYITLSLAAAALPLFQR